SGAAPEFSASSTTTGNGGARFPPLAPGRVAHTPPTSGANALPTPPTARGDTMTPRTRRPPYVPPARPRPPAPGPRRARAGPHHHAITRAETQQRCRALAQMGVDQFAFRAVRKRQHRAAVGVDQLEVHQAAAAEMHAGLFLTLAPQRDCDVADPHCLGDLG